MRILLMRALVLQGLLACLVLLLAEPELRAEVGAPAWITEESRFKGELGIGIGRYVGVAPAIEPAYLDALVSLIESTKSVFEDQRKDGVIVRTLRRRVAVGSGIVCDSKFSVFQYVEDPNPNSAARKAAIEASPLEEQTVLVIDRSDANGRMRYQKTATRPEESRPSDKLMSHDVGCEIENRASMREQVPIRDTYVQPLPDGDLETFVRIEVPTSQFSVLLHERKPVVEPLELPDIPRPPVTMPPLGHAHPFPWGPHSEEEHSEPQKCRQGSHDCKEGAQ